ncbi:hypothetical protein MBAV_002544 [Candidatus Magnetobacterium bavaricum]|uniref:Uncharacterized protein n=1 Tax=Candidatus Magnetobacterium bavaricum TaxID=29290 RepID=A0A0F3GX67_9BACT|nr:hypothetical protein MBAV_002544 [Candidatus Magnetobacterium bavaricum]
MLYRITRAGDGQHQNQLWVPVFNNIRQKNPICLNVTRMHIVDSFTKRLKFLRLTADKMNS